MSKPWFGLAALLLVGAAAVVAWWRLDLRFRPRTLSKDAGEIQALLDRSGWVSPGLPGPRALWMISYRSCPDCIRFEDEEFPRLQRAGVDTRVIMTPGPEANGAERAGIAALWGGRSWKLYRTWTSVPVAAWTAKGLPPADSDPARAAQVRKAETFVRQIVPLLKENGVEFAYPTLIWRDRKGRLRACACERRESYGYMRAELGAT